MPRQFVLPDLGEGIAEAQIVRVLVKPGDKVAEDQYLMEVETDKAAVEIPSPYGGVIKEMHVKEGDTVNVGDVIVTFDEGNGAAPAKAERTESKSAKAETPKSPTPARQAASSPSATAVMEAPASRRTTSPAAPAVRKLAREVGVDIDSLAGSGAGGRVTKDDVERAAQGGRSSGKGAESAAARRPVAAPSAPLPGTPDNDKWGPIRREPLSQIRKTIAAQMTRSKTTIPHVTHCDEVDITHLDRLRRQLNEATGDDPKLTIMAFVIRAVSIALRKFPIFNASFDEEGQQIVYKDYVNIGVAVDSDRGLIVPVIRNADQLTLRGIAAELRGIADRVRSNKFAIEDLRGGTFTITNVGALGGTVSTPVINHPEVAILGLGRSREMPVVKDGNIESALVLPVNLSFDHRATDGANAARFTGEILSYLRTPAMFLLD
jgi:pyruvate dehydrogenase E2 component (dihydrolipoamide acetyltransferase)